MTRIRTPLGALAVGAMVFATVFAAASALTVTSNKLPQSGSTTAVSCDTNGVNLGYTVSGNNVTEIVVTGDDCTTGTITLVAGTYSFVQTATQNNAPTVTYTLDPSMSIATFNPGIVSVTILP